MEIKEYMEKIKQDYKNAKISRKRIQHIIKSLKDTYRWCVTYEKESGWENLKS